MILFFINYVWYNNADNFPDLLQLGRNQLL